MSFSSSPDSCARVAFAITPADSDLVQPARALYVGGAGNLTIETVGGSTVTLTAIPAGVFVPISVKRVAEATTATSIIGLV
jgi:hypothetical protein